MTVVRANFAKGRPVPRRCPRLRVIEGGFPGLGPAEGEEGRLVRAMTPWQRKIFLEAGEMLLRGVHPWWVARWAERQNDARRDVLAEIRTEVGAIKGKVVARDGHG